MSSDISTTTDAETDEQPNAHGPTLSRRRLLQATAGAGTIAATGASPLSPVGEAEAVAPIVIAGGAAVAGSVAGGGAGAGVGWALREYEVIGADDPPEGETPEALRDRAYNAARTRKSTNGSRFIDNQNILEGIHHAAYGDGKMEAIDALNEQESEADVIEAGLQGVNDYATMVKENFLKGWNESVQELQNLWLALDEHEETDPQDVLMAYSGGSDNDLWSEGEEDFASTEYELPDGSTIEIERIRRATTHLWDPTDVEGGDDFSSGIETDHGDVEYLRAGDDWDEPTWDSIFQEMEETFDDVRNGIITWVEGVYGDVQSGELDTEELLTPRELAEMTSDDEDFNQAAADLMALNVAVDLEREAEVLLQDVGATVFGSIATTSDGTLSTGTIDPDADDASYYLTYDISQGEGEWSEYDDGVDGGTVTFTAEPFEETVYYIDTVAGETAEVTYGDFDGDEDAGEWTVDIGNQLDDAITDIDTVEYYSEVEETTYETIQLSREFEIVTFRDSDGEEHDEADFTRSEPQSDDNYISEDEWDEMQARHEELIEDYEDAQSGPVIGDPGDLIDGVGTNGAIGIIVAGGVIGLGALAALNPFN